MYNYEYYAVTEYYNVMMSAGLYRETRRRNHYFLPGSEKTFYSSRKYTVISIHFNTVVGYFTVLSHRRRWRIYNICEGCGLIFVHRIPRTYIYMYGRIRVAYCGLLFFNIYFPTTSVLSKKNQCWSHRIIWWLQGKRTPAIIYRLVHHIWYIYQ